MKKYLITVSIVYLIFCSNIISAQGEPANPPGTPKDAKINFIVKWDGKSIPGITKISGLRRKTEIIETRGGGDPSLARRSPGKTEYQPIVLKRPRTHDKEFERWANKVWSLGSGLGSEVSPKDYRKDMVIELRDETGKVLMAFRVYRCWPSKYSPLNEFNANSTQVAVESLVLEHEGWERDVDAREPVEPSFTKP